LKHRAILEKLAPESAGKDYGTFLHLLDEHRTESRDSILDWFEVLSDERTDGHQSHAFLIRQAELANEKLRGMLGWSHDESDHQNGKISGDHTNGVDDVPQSSFVPEHGYPLEEDFTVAGTPSKLGCPFAKVTGLATSMNGRHSFTPPHSAVSKQSHRSKRRSFNDPIRAEVCHNDTHVSMAVDDPEDIEASTAVCPIRFLDQHSPEEVAEYFENHKHELPRSHEVCVKRFQSNAEQIRQLDAKYGNLVSMISGLGQKHQAWLPEKPADDEDAIEDHEASEKVKDWARAVSRESLHNENRPIVNPEVSVRSPSISDGTDDEREQRFDRSLKEIRVGESPSRPWGITVPAKYEHGHSEADHSSVPAEAPPEVAVEAANKPSACPFDHGKVVENSTTEKKHAPATGELPKESLLNAGPKGTATSNKPTSASTEKSPPQMIFNGPVFFGYSPEMVKQVMDQGLFGKAS
jgi:hypothetical protein